MTLMTLTPRFDTLTPFGLVRFRVEFQITKRSVLVTWLRQGRTCVHDVVLGHWNPPNEPTANIFIHLVFWWYMMKYWIWFTDEMENGGWKRCLRVTFGILSQVSRNFFDLPTGLQKPCKAEFGREPMNQNKTRVWDCCTHFLNCHI